MPEEFFRQLTAEQLVPKLVKGYRRLEWVKVRERNEALDTRVYARAAAAQYGIDRFGERHWKALEAQIRSSADTIREMQQVPAGAPSSAVNTKPVAARRTVRSRFLDR